MKREDRRRDRGDAGRAGLPPAPEDQRRRRDSAEERDDEKRVAGAEGEPDSIIWASETGVHRVILQGAGIPSFQLVI